MSGAAIVAGFALRESLRRRVFVVVALLTVAFLALYGLGTWQIAKEVDDIGNSNGVEGRIVAGATLLGLSMFATLFLGAILAVFLTLGAVRGDAERGLLQPLLVRPLPRATFLLGRFAAAAGVCALYVIVVFLAVGGDHRRVRRLVAGPARRARARARRGRGRDRGAGARRLGRAVEHGERDRGLHALRRRADRRAAGPDRGGAVSSDTLENVSQVASWVLPFEALYQTALSAITADTFGFTRFAIDLGPFGGAQSFGVLLGPYAVAYTLAVGAAALWAFRRRDL